MTELIRYEAARQALADARRVDEVKDVRDKAEAMRLYARQAQDVELEVMAADIRLRGERRLGELLIEAKDQGRLARGRPDKCAESEQLPRLKLDDYGIDRKLSVRAQRMGGIAEQAFEAMVARTREAIRDRGSRSAFAALNTEEKQERRANRERVLAACQQNLPTKKYGVIYADPEWRFEVYSRDTGMDRAADNHYPTSSTDAICRREVPSIAADDCVLFLWATVPMLPDALKVMTAWGFTYKSHIVWLKDRTGTGYWFRNEHELLLVGTKGNPPAPAPGTQWRSVEASNVRAHSQKPECFYTLIETYFPNLPKIELNARAAREGWDSWGYEAPSTTNGNPLSFDKDTGEIHESESEAQQSSDSSAPETEPALRTDRPLPPASAMSSCSHGDGAAVRTMSPKPPHNSGGDIDVPDFLRRGHPDCVMDKT